MDPPSGCRGRVWNSRDDGSGWIYSGMHTIASVPTERTTLSAGVCGHRNRPGVIQRLEGPRAPNNNFEAAVDHNSDAGTTQAMRE